MKHAVIFLDAQTATVIALPEDKLPKAGDTLELDKCLLQGHETFQTLRLPAGPIDGVELNMENLDILAEDHTVFKSTTSVKFGSYMGNVTLSQWIREQIFIRSTEKPQLTLPVFFIHKSFTPHFSAADFISSPSRDLEQPPLTDLFQ